MGRLLIVLALVAAACGGSEAGSAIAPTANVGTASAPSGLPADDQVIAAVEQTPVEGSGDSSSAETTLTTTRVRPDGRDAPDFALALGQGGEFRLSDEERPVYMVFWAEW
ncbi:MAG: hypothetical protein V3S62_02525 [Acidimicrobiia bacterium]